MIACKGATLAKDVPVWLQRCCPFGKYVILMCVCVGRHEHYEFIVYGLKAFFLFSTRRSSQSVPRDSGGEDQRVPHSIPVPESLEQKMMVDACSGESANEGVISQELEYAVTVVEALASSSVVNVAPPCSTTLQLFGQGREI